MANQITVNSGSGNITVTTSRSVIGTVANVASANYANFAGEVVDPSQPNITSVGNLTGLTVNGLTTTDDLVVTGNLQIGNLTANNANYANFAGEAFNVNGSNVTGAVANATFAANAGFATTAGSANTATVANSANSVTLANVSGAGNIASINLDGSASNVLYGNGIFAPAATGNVANANYANFAGNAFSVDGGNVVGAVANANFAANAGFAANANVAVVANSANSVAGANVTGAVANATFATTANNANNANNATNVSVGTSTGTLYPLMVTSVSAGLKQTFVDGGGEISWNAGTNVLNVNGNITANTITANTFVGDISVVNVDYIDFDTANGAPAHQTGRLSWDSAKATLVVGMNGQGNIDQQIGEDQYIYVIANATITAGQVLQFSGVQGDTILAVPANTSNPGFIPRYVFGVAPANIANGAGGYAQTFGEVYNLQTNAFPAGSILYLQPNSNGALTATEPTAPDPKIVVAACLTQSTTPSATNGRIQVRPDFGYYMDQLHNVSNATATTGDVLVYNASNVYAPSNTVPVANTAYSVDGANVSGTVANATYADNAGNANIANVAYSVDAANVVGLGNIATINLDGNASNLLDGTGNWVAIPASANANFANFAGEVINAAQPNITSTGTLTVLNANTSTPITVESGNGNILFRTVNSANTAGRRLAFEYVNPVTFNTAALGADENGFGYFIANTAPGNVFPGNIKSYWQFLNNGNLQHTIGGTGFVVAKGFVAGTGNVSAGNVTASVSITAPNITANTGIFTGNAAGLTNIPGANVTGIVANATYADNAGNANIANIAYSVDAANVVGLGNIAVINLDGNASNLLDGTGNFVAIPTDVANANYANFAGDIVNSAQPNITSVGTLTALTTNATSNVVIGVTNNSAILSVTANANGFTTQQLYNGTHIQQSTQAGASEAGFTITTANTNPGNTFPSNLKGVWRFDATGNLAHLIGGTGAIVAKQGVFGTGNVSAGNISATANISAGNISATANISAGNVTATATISGNIANVNNISSASTLNLSTNGITNGIAVTGRNITLNGANTGAGDISSINLVNGALNWTLDNTTFSGGTPFGMNRYNVGFLEPLNYYTARGSQSSPADVQVGDAAYSERMQVRYNGATSSIFNGDVTIESFSPANTVAAKYTIASYDDQANSVFQVNFGTSNIAGNLQIGAANSFLKLASIDSSVLANITGVGGQIAAVDDQGGKLAYWDTTNNRWSYVFDNSAV